MQRLRPKMRVLALLTCLIERALKNHAAPEDRDFLLVMPGVLAGGGKKGRPMAFGSVRGRAAARMLRQAAKQIDLIEAERDMQRAAQGRPTDPSKLH